MSEAQTLTTSIVINAKTGNGFSEVGNTLTELGSLVNGLSEQIISFGRKSSDVYKNYEYSMKQAETALATKYGRGTKELTDVMSQLDEAASSWAENSIFHTNDIANAINEAAHANWDLEQILGGMPAVMDLAQAGGMDLSEAFHYVAAAMAGLDVPYEDLGEFIDMWTFAANSSLGDAQSFGEAMSKMGSVMRFTGSREELFALIGLMHDMGTSGSEAATMLRTSMLRILAPSGTAQKALGQLEDTYLATNEEIQAILEDADASEASKILESYGFNAFDANGQAKPILQIFSELGEVLAEISGGWENITKNETALDVMNKVFGTRGIVGATNIVNGLQHAVELQGQLQEGAATGYGDYSSDVMNDTYYGQIELLSSKIEELERRTGGVLAEQLKPIMSFLGGIVTNISNLDEGTFNALVSGMEVIALAGPGLLLTGSAFRIIGAVLSPAGAIGMGLVGLTAAAAAINELKEADLAGAFGTATIDSKGVTDYLKTITSDFDAAYTKVDAFRSALDASVTSYATASSTFSSSLLTDMLTGVTLTDDDKAKYQSLGQDMYESVLGGITNGMAASSSYMEALFGGEGTAEYDPEYQYLIDLTTESYNSAIAQVESLSWNLRNAMTEAFDDGTVSPEEYQELLTYMENYNAALEKAAVEAEDNERRFGLSKMLRKGQTASLDEIKELGNELEVERAEAVAKEEDRYLDALARADIAHQDRLRGMTDEDAIAEENANYAAAIQALEANYNQRILEVTTPYDETLLSLYNSQIAQSDNSKKAHKALDSRIQAVAVRAAEDRGFTYDSVEQSLQGEMDLTKDPATALQNLTVLVNGDTTNLNTTIMKEDGTVITTEVYGDTTELAAAIMAHEGETIRVHVAADGLLNKEAHRNGPSRRRTQRGLRSC